MRTRYSQHTQTMPFGLAMLAAILFSFPLEVAAIRIPALLLFLAASALIHIQQFSSWFSEPKQCESQPVLYYVALLGLVALVGIYLYRLEDIPHTFIGDIIRDGPQDARNLLGTPEYFLAPGSYEGYSRLLAALYVPFEWAFPRSIVACRLFTSCIAALSIYIFYRIVSQHFSFTAAFAASVCFATTPLVLFLARENLVVIFNLLIAVTCLCCFVTVKRELTRYEAARLGFICGWSCYFHLAAVSTVLVTVISCTCYRVLSRELRENLAKSFVPFLLGLMLAVGSGLSYFSGLLGATLNRLDPYAPSEGTAWYILEKYLYTISRLVAPLPREMYIPPISGSLISTPAVVFLAIGVGLLRNNGNPMRPIIVLSSAAFLTLIFLNSAITDFPNTGHRIVVVIPFLMYLVAAGVGWVEAALGGLSAKARGIVVGSDLFQLYLVGTFIFSAVMYVVSMEKSESRNIDQCSYLVSLVARELRNLSFSELPACLNVPDEATYSCFNLAHSEQALYYFAAGHQVTLAIRSSLPEKHLEISLCGTGQAVLPTREIALKNSWKLTVDASVLQVNRNGCGSDHAACRAS